MKKVVSKILIIIGIAMILVSFTIKIYSKNKEKQAIKNFSQKLELQQKQEQNNEDGNEQNEEYEEIVVAERNYENDNGIEEIALIQIPSINVDSVVVEGIEKQKLRYYLGHFEDTAMPGEVGNFSIAGHSSIIYNEILNNLHKVEIGDEIKIQTEKGNFNYIITEKFIVEPTELSVLKQDEDKKSMTIVTCTNKGQERLIVKAEIKE